MPEYTAADFTENIKKLIKNCEQQLSFTVGGGGIDVSLIRRPQCPLVNVFWDGLPDGAREVITEPFERIWSVGLNPKESIGSTDGSMDAETLNDNIRDSAVILKQSVAIPDKSSVNIAHYMNILMPDFDEQIDTICASYESMDKGLMGTAYLLVFVICDDKSFKKSDLIRERILKTEEKLRTLPTARGFYLSNRLADGTLLDTDKNHENYRVAADIALLASTSPDEAHHEPNNLIAWMMSEDYTSFTASYKRMQKPANEISHVLLQQIVDYRIRMAKKNRDDLVEEKYAHNTPIAFWKEAGINGLTLPCLETAFQESVKLRLPGSSAFENLPNWKKASKNNNYEEACNLTDGFLKLFVQRYFNETGADISAVNVDAICNTFISDLSKKFDYLFVKDYFPTCADHLNVITPEKSQGIMGSAIYQAKYSFYEAMKPALKAAMLKYAKQAEAFARSLNELQQRLTIPNMAITPGLTPVDVYYRGEADKQLTNSGENILRAIQPTDDNGKLCESLFQAYRSITDKKPELYHASLEDEQEARVIGQASGSAAKISSTLDDPSLDIQQRIKATNYLNKKSYYIYYGKAVFGNSLKQPNGRVVTSCMDSAERLILNALKAETVIW